MCKNTPTFYKSIAVTTILLLLLAPHTSHAQSLSYWKGQRWVLAKDGTLENERQILRRQCVRDNDVRANYFVSTGGVCTELADHSFVTDPTSGVVTWIGGVSHPSETEASRVNASMHDVAGTCYGAGVFVLPGGGFSIPYGVTWDAHGVGGVDTIVLLFDNGGGISVDTVTVVSKKEYDAAKNSVPACVNTPPPDLPLADVCAGLKPDDGSNTIIIIILVASTILILIIVLIVRNRYLASKKAKADAHLGYILNE
jgi:uncharacterized integral membrane protein